MPSLDIATLLTLWQSRLRLKDWNVTVEFVDFLDDIGAIERGRYQDANIEICSPHTIGPDFAGNRDVEVTLVHELLHLYTYGFDHLIEKGSQEDKALEVFVELTAQALVALARENRKYNATNGTTE